MDLNLFGSLDSDPHCGKKLDPDPHENQCGSTTLVRPCVGSAYCVAIEGSFFSFFFGRLECVGHSFANVVNFLFLRDVWIRTQGAAVASRLATNLAPPSPY